MVDMAAKGNYGVANTALCDVDRETRKKLAACLGCSVCKIQPVGTQVLAVAAAGQGTASEQPQRKFAPWRLFLDTNIADDFEIRAIKLANVDQLITNTAVPGSAFTADSVGVDFDLDCIDAALLMEIDFTNLAAVVRDFRAMWLGGTIWNR
jgi:hypothetical protein